MFSVIKEEVINNSKCCIFEHSCGARLITIENDDCNKVFSVSFRTLPNNDCGTPHIVEHCVLCGSEGYNVKDPFNELEKGSLHTYLNAMTYEDKTIYPVASCNEFDFEKMTRVYIDAVFKPLIFKKQGIFLQEGWSYGENGLNGVVLNEMKGVFSAPDRILSYNVNKELFKGSGYQYYSGGVPEKITKLKYEDFLNFYSEHYHPSNAVFYIYGDMNVEKYMDIIEAYISKSEYKPNKFSSEIEVKKSNDVVARAKLADDKNVLNVSFSVGRCTNAVLMLAFNVLSDVLLGNENGVLKKGLAKFGSKVGYSFNDSRYLPVLSICIDKSDEKNVEALKSEINSILKEAVKNGLDKTTVRGAINKLKFYLKDGDFGYKPRGLYYNLLILNSVLYGEDSFANIDFDKLFEELENVNFEKLISEYLIDKGCFGILLNEEAEKNNDNAFTINDRELKAYQAQKDSESELLKIPMINIDDIEKSIPRENTLKHNRGVYVPIENSEIVYLNFLFDISMVDIEDIGFASVYAKIMPKYNARLKSDIDIYIGDLTVGTSVYKKEEGYIPCICIKIKTLKENINKTLELIEKMLFSDISDEERVKKLVAEARTQYYNLIIKNGNVVASNRALSYIDDSYSYKELLSGIECYKFLCKDRLYVNKLCDVRKKIIASNNFYVSLACAKSNLSECERLITNFYNNLESADNARHFVKKSSIKSEKIVVNSSVQYNALVGRFEQYNGSMRVLSHIINSDYIWSVIRGVGGAYGGNCVFSTSGNFKICSYRDPKVLETYNSYYALPSYIKNLSLTDRELKKYIIGAINIIDKPKKDSIRADIALRRLLKNTSEDELQECRNQLLATNIKGINNYAEVLDNIISQGYISSVGEEKDMDLFEEVIRIN